MRAAHYGPNPFCVSCGGYRHRRHGATLCEPCMSWGARQMVRLRTLIVARRRRAAFALVGAGPVEVRP